MAQANDDTTTPSAPSRGALQSINQLRKDAADRIERLIGFLDATAADPDLEDDGSAEPQGDDEPTLGWTSSTKQDGQDWTGQCLAHHLDEAEVDTADDEPECEDEGAEHDGCEPDEDGEPQGDEEPSYTSTSRGSVFVADRDEQNDKGTIPAVDKRRRAYRYSRSPAGSNVRPLNGSDGVLVIVNRAKS